MKEKRSRNNEMEGNFSGGRLAKKMGYV